MSSKISLMKKQKEIKMPNISEQKKNANGLANDFTNKANDSSHQLSKMIYDSGEKVGNMASDLVSSAKETIAESKDYVKENPYKGVAFAAAAGLVTGSLLSSLFRRSRD